MFRDGRTEFAIPSGTLTDIGRASQLSAFFFWTAWAASTNRPGDTVSFTSNWPYEPLVDNRPTGEGVVWTGVSIILLLAGIGAMAWWHASHRSDELRGDVPADDPWLAVTPTPFVFGLSTGHSYGPETGRSTEPVSGQPPAYLPAR